MFFLFSFCAGYRRQQITRTDQGRGSRTSWQESRALVKNTEPYNPINVNSKSFEFAAPENDEERFMMSMRQLKYLSAERIIQRLQDPIQYHLTDVSLSSVDEHLYHENCRLFNASNSQLERMRTTIKKLLCVQFGTRKLTIFQCLVFVKTFFYLNKDYSSFTRPSEMFKIFQNKRATSIILILLKKRKKIDSNVDNGSSYNF